MFSREDIEQALLECQADRNPDANTCMVFASLLTIKKLWFNDSVNSIVNSDEPPIYQRYSSLPPPVETSANRSENKVHIDSDSEFADAINGMDNDKAWRLIDELMEALSVLNTRLYNSVMDRLIN